MADPVLKDHKGLQEPQSRHGGPPPTSEGVQEEKGKSPRTSMEVPLLLEDKGEGEMFLEILVLLLCHCFCLLDVLEMGHLHA